MESAKLKLIPHIWADTILRSLQASMEISSQIAKEWQEQHEERMANDPDYAKAYERRQAEDEAESYWIALYDNQLPEYEDEDY